MSDIASEVTLFKDDPILLGNLQYPLILRCNEPIVVGATGLVVPLVLAMPQPVRDRARVVDIGQTRLDLPWNAYYEKELDVRFSRSYGPGRYDDRYELEGIDYPAGYVLSELGPDPVRPAPRR